jgi:alpha-L-rhamnosidase
VAQSAQLLGHTGEAQKYQALTEEVREAFVQAFVTPAGRVLSDSQTTYALAIEWDLLPRETQRREAGRRLADLVRASGFRISTGFVGTPLICDALTRTGHLDVACRLLLQTQCPSWLYPVTMGATTVWERWDSMRPDGSINPDGMTSFNHYALGAVADWMHRTVAGLAPGAPGYRRLIVRPRPPVALTSAAARHITAYGEASVSWERSDDRLQLTVVVPVGSSAEVHVPGTEAPSVVGHGRHHWSVDDPHAGRADRTVDWAQATVRDVLDDPDTWADVVGAALASGVAPEGEAQAARRLAAYFDAPAATVAEALAPDERFPGGQDIRQRIAKLSDAAAAPNSRPKRANCPPDTSAPGNPV